MEALIKSLLENYEEINIDHPISIYDGYKVPHLGQPVYRKIVQWSLRPVRAACKKTYSATCSNRLSLRDAHSLCPLAINRLPLQGIFIYNF